MASIEGYGSHSCMIGFDGSLWCWGPFPVSQSPLVPEPAPIRVASELGAIDLVSTGNYGTCAQPASGPVRCWGRGFTIGADFAAQLAPVRVADLSGRGPVD